MFPFESPNHLSSFGSEYTWSIFAPFFRDQIQSLANQYEGRHFMLRCAIGIQRLSAHTGSGQTMGWSCSLQPVLVVDFHEIKWANFSSNASWHQYWISFSIFQKIFTRLQSAIIHHYVNNAYHLTIRWTMPRFCLRLSLCLDLYCISISWLYLYFWKVLLATCHCFAWNYLPLFHGL